MLRRLILIALLFPALVLAQEGENPFNIKEPKGLFKDRCQEYSTILKNLPADVRYSVLIEDGIIFFLMPSLEHFQQIFDKNGDGIAIDILHKDQYACETESYLGNSWPHRGFLLAPLYKKEMEEKMFFDGLNNVIVEYGPLPAQFQSSEIECNVLTLQQKALCNYSIISNIEFGTWDLLDLGFYWDSVPQNKKISDIQILSKTIEFTIPFEKNQSRFLDADIKPLYDSLEINDFDIMELSILAYTSVEGSVELNKTLQTERAQSMIDALQAYQTQEIKTNILTQENWSQFAKDIAGTKFQYLKKHSQDDIRSFLSKDKELLLALEPMLARQRKGLVKLVLQKKRSVYENDPEALKSIFHESLSEPELEQAILLQHYIFERIRNETLPDEFIDQLQIPKESAFGPLFNNIVLFNWERHNYDLHQAIQALEDFQQLSPKSAKLKYNLAALKIQAWSEGNTPTINKEAIEKLIKSINKTDLHPSLVERLKINYYLLLTQYLTYDKKFKKKRKSVRSIYSHYKKLNLGDDEVLSLAKFMAFYSEFDIATDVLYPSTKSEDVSEDLLFYYLKLTIGNPKYTEKADYKNNLQKAVSLNQERYCALFLPKAQGGFTFQLKESTTLKKSYCENCPNN